MLRVAAPGAYPALECISKHDWPSWGSSCPIRCSRRRGCGCHSPRCGWGTGAPWSRDAAPDFTGHPNVINGCSDLLLELYGETVGQHARSAVGMASLPFNIPVEIEAEVEFAPR
jgi:hypothetical protein